VDSSAEVGQVVRACFAAFAGRDRPAMQRLLADDFHFTSPMDNRLDRAGFFEYCWKGGESIEGFEIHDLVVDGDRAFVLYEARLAGKRTRNVEIQRARGRAPGLSRAAGLARFGQIG
jgi:ketosteroid isomerase-like protein